MENQNGGPQKKLQPFLRKGQGLARFNKISYPVRRSDNSTTSGSVNRHSSEGSENHQEVTAFFRENERPSSHPLSARTVDSGISHEGPSPFDEEDIVTRPPTVTSIIDAESFSARRNSVENPQSRAQSRAAPRVEESIDYFAPGQEFVNDISVSRRPSESTSSSVSTEGREKHLYVQKAQKDAELIDKMRSVNGSQYTASSGLSTPIGARESVSRSQAFSKRMELHPPAAEEWRQMTEKPKQALDCSKIVAFFPHVRPRSFPSASEIPTNAGNANRIPLSGVQLNGRKPQDFVLETPVEPAKDRFAKKKTRFYAPEVVNLMTQLRNSIAHLDYADDQLRRTAKKMRDEYEERLVRLEEKEEELKAHWEQKKNGLEAEWKEKLDGWLEEKRLDEERNVRDRRQLESDRRLLTKNESERVKILTKEVADSRKNVHDKETKMAKMRVEKRAVDEKLKESAKALENSQKDCERLKRVNATLEKNLRQTRQEVDRLNREGVAEAKVLANHSRRLSSNLSGPRENPVDSAREKRLSEERRSENYRKSRSRSVTWDDVHDATESFDTQDSDPMNVVAAGVGPFGRYHLLRNLRGETTKHTTTIDGDLFEYDNGDQRWINHQRTFQIYNYSVDGMISWKILPINKIISVSQNGEMQIWRPDGSMSVVYGRHKVRMELALDSRNSYFPSETFDCFGFVSRRGIHGVQKSKYSIPNRYSVCDGGRRYVDVKQFDDFEFVEPEFRLRWVCGEAIVCKIFVPNGNTLKLQVDRKEVILESVGCSAEVEPPKGSKWDPIKRFFLRTKKREGSDEETDPDVLTRWTAACLNSRSPMFSSQPPMNAAFSPAPSLLAFAAFMLASDERTMMIMRNLFQLSTADITELGEKMEKLSKLKAKKNFHCFVRIVVDEESTTTVGTALMATVNRIGHQQVFVSARPSRAIRFALSLNCAPDVVDLPRPHLLTTNAFCSAGVVASWAGETDKASNANFSSTYSLRYQHAFFELNTTAIHASFGNFEVWQLPLLNKASPNCKITIFRPFLLGNLTGEMISDLTLQRVFDRLEKKPSMKARVLMPKFSAHFKSDSFNYLLSRGVMRDLGQTAQIPFVGCVWQWTTVAIDEQGVTCKQFNQKSMKKVIGRISSEELYFHSRPYSLRLDSPFMYVISIDKIPMVAGKYFGHPAPKPKDYSIPFPDRSEKKIRIKKPKEKVTKKQKRRQQLRKRLDKEKVEEQKKASKSRASSIASKIVTSTLLNARNGDDDGFCFFEFLMKIRRAAW
ncbi:unnamed protein product [Caenorhabditis auriculariae]|uniref:Uncharacterized protein n=1 Tax=Caenorhabditis auriculariae TaxID=2777116 RepID=A0A8S1GZ37_9PELO|nr:unnamed protein product [Caenorhabditis auriculariae]